MSSSRASGSNPSLSAMSAHVSAASTRPANGESYAKSDQMSTGPQPTTVNRKKQKRRQKQAARMAAESRCENGHIHHPDVAEENSLSPVGPESHPSDDHDFDESVDGDVYYDEEPRILGAHPAMAASSALDARDDQAKLPGRKSKKKKGKKGRSGSQTLGDESSTPLSTPSVSMSHPLVPPLPPHFGARTILKSTKDRSIWNTSTQEERENIKAFWLELGEEERRQLVKVEKDAVLKKMKEQQKHSCSCTVCGRKRTAIEEELEVLYDAYYEELEQYANNNQGSFEKGPPIMPPPRLYHPPLRSPGQHTRTQGQFHPSRGRIHELPEEDEEFEEDYDEEDEDDEPYSDEEYEDDDTRARADFFAFGNSLTVKDGILTVADDLLKNDGKHFIDMMEQLAERRMQREEDTQFGIAAAHQSLHDHNHGPYDEDDYDEEEEDDYDSQEDEEYEEDEMDAMTEEQRMEEGRRMFQIFAARMFEQRVLTAYREKVAEQRQKKLIEELLEEESRTEQRNAKKAREAQKRKDKKKLQKQAKEEEKARREAEKAAEEAALKAEQAKKLEEQKRKREEQRKKREAERKAQEEEKARREAEKQRKLREERERQAELERKHREQKEQEKRRREETRRREQEEREERERKAQARKDRDSTDFEKRDTPSKRASQPGPMPISNPLQQHVQGSSGHLQSPHLPGSTPVVAKAPTPARARQSSQQGSHTSSPRSQAASAEPSQTSISPRSMGPSQSSGASSVASKQGQGYPMLHHPQPSTPLSPLGAMSRSHPPGFPSPNGLPSNPPGLAGMVPRPPIGHELPTYPPHTGPLMNQMRGFPAPNGISMAPSINGTRQMPLGRGFPLDPGHGLPFHAQAPLSSAAFSAQQSGLSQSHSRQPSNSFERSPLDTHAQPFPISRPSPIKRPSSTQQDQHDDSNRARQRDMDNLSARFGSSALLDNSDAPFSSNLSQSLPGATVPGSLPGPTRASFAAPSLFPDPLGASKPTGFSMNPGVGSNPWGGHMAFGASAFPGTPTWGTAHGSGWSNNAFGSGGHHRAHTSRPVAIRLLVIEAWKQLNTMSPKGASGHHDAKQLLRQVDQLRPSNEPSISLKEMLDICDTEGNSQNGGGSFSIRSDSMGEFVKFEPDTNSATSGHRGSIAPGEIGSPIPSSSIPAFGGIGTTPAVLRQYSSPPTGF